MAITTYSGLVAALAAGEKIGILKSTVISQTAGRYCSLFRAAGRPGAASNATSGAGNTCDRTTAGAIPWSNPTGGNTAYLGAWQILSTLSSGLELADRLVETSGLDGTVTGAQTVNSVALPSRATGGDGVELWLECYTALGSTAQTTVTASYTDQAGNTGHTATLIGGVPATLTAGQMVPFALVAGDTGVRSVQSVTLGGSTGTAGNFGITLLKRFGAIQTLANSTQSQGWGDTGLPVIQSDACMFPIWLNSSTSTGVISGQLLIAKG